MFEPEKTRKSFKSKIEFGKSKIKKIYPAYIVSLVVMLPCTYFGLRPYGSVINTGLKSLMLLGVDLSLLQSVTGMTFFSHSLNGVCWFLSCIFVCYIVMAFVIKKIDNIRSKREAEVCFLISIIIVLLLSLAASKIEQMNLSGGKINDLWYGHPAIRWWYLLIGAILGTLYKKTDIEFGTLTEVGITAVACVYFVLRNSLLEIMNQNFLRFFDLLLCSMVLLGFSKGTGFISQALSNNRMLWLSRTTMYLYLFHYPVRVLVDNFFVEINAISTLGEVGFIFECFLIIAITSYHVIETLLVWTVVMNSGNVSKFIFENPLLVKIGNISEVIFLTHLPVIAYMRIIWEKMVGNQYRFVEWIVILLCIFVTAYGVSYIQKMIQEKKLCKSSI